MISPYSVLSTAAFSHSRSPCARATWADSRIERQLALEGLRRPRHERQGVERQAQRVRVVERPGRRQRVLAEHPRRVAVAGEGQRAGRATPAGGPASISSSASGGRRAAAGPPSRRRGRRATPPRRTRGRRRSAGRVAGALGEVVGLEAALLRPGDVAGAHRGVGDAQQQVDAPSRGDRQRRLEEAGGVVVGDRRRRGLGGPTVGRHDRSGGRRAGPRRPGGWAISAHGPIPARPRARRRRRGGGVAARRCPARRRPTGGSARGRTGSRRRRTRRRCATARRRRASPARAPTARPWPRQHRRVERRPDTAAISSRPRAARRGGRGGPRRPRGRPPG